MYFEVITKAWVINQFFGWLLGFGKKFQIISPPEVREQSAEYLDKIKEIY